MSQEVYVEKLREWAKEFTVKYFKKEYHAAKYIYDSAIRVAEFLELPQDIRDELFGYRDDNDMWIDGRFEKSWVEKAYLECTINTYKSYEVESYRRFGQPPQYYPQPRYPVPGYQKE